MSRTTLAILVALLISTNPVFAADPPPSIPETLEYLKDRVNGAASGQWSFGLTDGAQVVGVTKAVRNYHLRTHVAGDPNDKKLQQMIRGKEFKPTAYLLVIEVQNTYYNTRTVPVPQGGLDDARYPDSYSNEGVVDLAGYDASAVTVTKTLTVDGVDLLVPVYLVALKDSGPKGGQFGFWVTDERIAQLAARALRHVLRELHGQPTVKRSTVDFFEKDLPPNEALPAAVVRKKATVTAVPPVPTVAPEVPKPVVDKERAAARNRLERELIDAEAEFVRATKQDADNKAANDAKRAALRKQLDDINAEARKARAGGRTDGESDCSRRRWPRSVVRDSRRVEVGEGHRVRRPRATANHNSQKATRRFEGLNRLAASPTASGRTRTGPHRTQSPAVPLCPVADGGD